MVYGIITHRVLEVGVY